MKKFMLGCLITLVLLGFFIPNEYIYLLKMVRYQQVGDGCLSDEEKIQEKIVRYRDERMVLARKFFACVKNKQNFIERVLIPVPEEWVSTSSDSK